VDLKVQGEISKMSLFAAKNGKSEPYCKQNKSGSRSRELLVSAEVLEGL
jgi:hypothetical protein